MRKVFGKTLVHDFFISYSHTEWYLFFSDSATIMVQLQVNILYSERKSRNTSALVNLYL